MLALTIFELLEKKLSQNNRSCIELVQSELGLSAKADNIIQSTLHTIEWMHDRDIKFSYSLSLSYS